MVLTWVQLSSAESVQMVSFFLEPSTWLTPTYAQVYKGSLGTDIMSGVLKTTPLMCSGGLVKELLCNGSCI